MLIGEVFFRFDFFLHLAILFLKIEDFADIELGFPTPARGAARRVIILK